MRRYGGSRPAPRLLLAGVVCIFGGEALCILGPLRYEHVVHLACHAVLYTGIVCVGIGAALHWSGRGARKAGNQS